MVLGKELIAIALTACAAIGFADINVQQAKDISTAFRLVAAKAGTSSIVGTPPSTNDPTVNEDKYPGCFYLDYIGDVTVVRKSDGIIVHFRMYDRSSNDSTWNESAKLTSSELRDLAQHYRDAAGMSGTVYVESITENKDVDPMIQDVWVSLQQGGVPYDRNHGSFFEISHTTGRLMAMELGEVPQPPDSVTPSITSSQAFATAVAYVNSEYGSTSFADLEAAKLCIWKPVSEIPAGQDNFLTSTHATMASNNQGMLIWNLFFEVRDDDPGKGGVYSPRYEVHVDAVTGDLLVVYQMMPFGGGGGSGTSGKSTPSPDLGAGPLAIEDVAVKHQLTLKSAVLSPVKAPKKRPEGRKVVLKRGRYSMLAWIDLESGLVWTEKDKRRNYAKLDQSALQTYRRLVKGRG